MNYKTFSYTYKNSEIRNFLKLKGYTLITLRRFLKDYMSIETPSQLLISASNKDSWLLSINFAFKNEEEIMKCKIKLLPFLTKVKENLFSLRMEKKHLGFSNSRYYIDLYDLEYYVGEYIYYNLFNKLLKETLKQNKLL